MALAYMTLSIEHCRLLKIVKGVKKSICKPQGIGLPYAIPVLKLSSLLFGSYYRWLKKWKCERKMIIILSCWQVRPDIETDYLEHRLPWDISLQWCNITNQLEKVWTVHDQRDTNQHSVFKVNKVVQYVHIWCNKLCAW